MRPLHSDTLVAIISGNRPDPKRRTTERKFTIDGNKWIICSNNSKGYETDLKIESVTDEFREYYEKNHALSKFGMMVGLNRSYAMKYARDNGYRYLVELDDNITLMELKYTMSNGVLVEKFYPDITPVMNVLTDVLRYTNAGLSGLNMMATPPEASTKILDERYVYSIMCVDLEKANYFFGDVEEDIHMRLQLAQRKIPTIQIIPIRYQKQGQFATGDTSGNRTEYNEMLTERGAILARMYGDKYERGKSNKVRNVVPLDRGGRVRDIEFYKHKLKQFKVGLKTTNNEKLKEAISTAFDELLTQPDRREKYK